MNDQENVSFNNQDDWILSEEDFYTTSDDRVLESRLYDIDDNTYSNHLKEWYELCNCEGYYDEFV